MKRRTFIKTTGLGAATVCTCGLSMNSCSMFSGISDTPAAPEESILFSENQVTLNLALIPELENAGGSVKFELKEYDEDPLKILVVNAENHGLMAYENRCSHGGREIEYQDEGGILQCVSFGHSKYDLNGRVTGGPAPLPIRKFNVIHTDNTLIINLV